MALRDQPYLPLYVQDYLTDEKLNECSAETQGIYIKIMCLLHKQNIYGSILLKQKHNKTPNNIENFAIQLDNHLPFTKDKIQEALTELIDENVMQLKGDILSQKRMVRDGEISLARSKAGKKGMDSRYNQDSFVITNTLTNDITNSEYENESEIIIGSKDKKKKKKEPKKKFIPPTLEEVEIYFTEKGFSHSLASRFHEYYESANWHDSKDKPVRNWKQKAIGVWFKKENKEPEETKMRVFNE